MASDLHTRDKERTSWQPTTLANQNKAAFLSNSINNLLRGCYIWCVTIVTTDICCVANMKQPLMIITMPGLSDQNQHLVYTRRESRFELFLEKIKERRYCSVAAQCSSQTPFIFCLQDAQGIKIDA